MNLLDFLPTTVSFILVPVLYGLIAGITSGIFAALRMRNFLVVIWTIVGSIIGVYIGSGIGYILFNIVHPNPDFIEGLGLIIFYLNSGMLIGSISGAEIGIMIFERWRRRSRS
ncbi:MAG TPA: hypothetical protein DDW76_31030 [Cyanobacteria bacterium UBA11369]|nr:hypothetical protein [Cyanobacteria bacterium UBA11371]HBE53080.1 hypothetical protein [Cyanobacteria bacterium UBA11369]